MEGVASAGAAVTDADYKSESFKIDSLPLLQPWYSWFSTLAWEIQNHSTINIEDEILLCGIEVVGSCEEFDSSFIPQSFINNLSTKPISRGWRNGGADG